MTEIIVAICSALTFIGTIITCYVTIKVNQAVTNTKIDELTREVREHNNFARRMPIVETEIEYLKEELNNVRKIEAN